MNTTLANVVELVENDEPLAPADAELVERLVRCLAPAVSDSRYERAELVRQYCREYCRRQESVRAKARKVAKDAMTYRDGEWRTHAHRVLCPIHDPRRALLWRLLKAGRLPGLTLMREILSDDQ